MGCSSQLKSNASYFFYNAEYNIWLNKPTNIGLYLQFLSPKFILLAQLTFHKIYIPIVQWLARLSMKSRFSHLLLSLGWYQHPPNVVVLNTLGLDIYQNLWSLKVLVSTSFVFSFVGLWLDNNSSQIICIQSRSRCQSRHWDQYSWSLHWDFKIHSLGLETETETETKRFIVLVSMLRLLFGQSRSRNWNPGLDNHCNLSLLNDSLSCVTHPATSNNSISILHQQ